MTEVRHSRVMLAVLLAAAAGLTARLLPDQWAAAWMIRVLGVSLAGMVVPGAAVLSAWRPRQSFSLLEFLGFSIAVSFAVLQLLTVAALTLHVSPSLALTVLAVVTAGHLYVAATRKNGGVVLAIDRWQL